MSSKRQTGSSSRSNQRPSSPTRREFLLLTSLSGCAGGLIAATLGGCGGTSARKACNRRVGDAHQGGVLCLAVAADGLLVSGGADAVAKLWQLPAGTLLGSLSGHLSAVTAVAISPDQTLLASGGADGTVKLWSRAGLSLVKSVDAHAGGVSSLVFSPNGSVLASGGADASIKLWNAADGSPVAALSGHTQPINALAVAPDGTYLVSAAEDSTLRTWNLTVPAPIATVTLDAAVQALAMSADGTQMVSVGAADGITLWAMPACTVDKAIEKTGRGYKAVAISPEKSVIATGGTSEVVQLWQHGVLAAAIQDHSASINALGVTTDGKLLISASGDSSIRLWQLPGGKFSGSASDPALPVRTVVSFSC